MKPGFVVWGIRNGFKNNWLSYNVNEKVCENFRDDLRQVCNNTSENFYSFEKTEDYSIITVYNPNFKDHVQRKAYIAISLLVPKGKRIKGHVLKCLAGLMDEYVRGESSPMSSMVSPEQMGIHLKHILLEDNPNYRSKVGSGIGYYYYEDINQLEVYFQKNSINQFRKVFFAGSPNSTLEQLPDIERIIALSTGLYLNLIGYNSSLYRITVNGQSVPGPRIEVVKGDFIRIQEISSFQSKQIQVGSTDLNIDLSELFVSNISYPDQSPSKKLRSVLLFLIFTVLILGGWLLLKPAKELNNSTPTTVNTTSEAESKPSAVYDFDTEEIRLKNLPILENQKLFRLLKSNARIIDSFLLEKPSFRSKDIFIKEDNYLILSYTDDSGTPVKEEIKVRFINIPKEYTTVKGDNQYRVAARFGIDEEMLKLWNGLKSDQLAIGVKLRLTPPNSRSPEIQIKTDTIRRQSSEPEAPAIKNEKVEQIGAGNKLDVKADETNLEQEKRNLLDLLKDYSPINPRDPKFSVENFKSRIEACKDLKCLNELKDKIIANNEN